MFNKGDVVMLKSGGPLMTVTGIVGRDHQLAILKASGFEDGDVTVEYFDMKNDLIKKTFKETSIELTGNK
jgi:uncharacterized protein YodC (DUF2158 family)